MVFRVTSIFIGISMFIDLVRSGMVRNRVSTKMTGVMVSP